MTRALEVSAKELHTMVHATAWMKRELGEHYRNYFVAPDSGSQECQSLEAKGLMYRRDTEIHGAVYHLTAEGLLYLKEALP